MRIVSPSPDFYNADPVLFHQFDNVLGRIKGRNPAPVYLVQLHWRRCTPVEQVTKARHGLYVAVVVGEDHVAVGQQVVQLYNGVLLLNDETHCAPPFIRTNIPTSALLTALQPEKTRTFTRPAAIASTTSEAVRVVRLETTDTAMYSMPLEKKVPGWIFIYAPSRLSSHSARADKRQATRRGDSRIFGGKEGSNSASRQKVVSDTPMKSAPTLRVTRSDF